MNFLLALQFLTRIPVKIKGDVQISHMARAMSFFPFIGLIIGLAAVLLHILLSFFWTEAVSDLITLGFLIVITGNMHIDGLMDSADGLFSGKSREKLLEIMRDSRVGSHGVIAGFLVLMLKFLLLLQLTSELKLVALLIMPVLGRWSQVYGAVAYSYARESRGAGDFTNYVGMREISWASITTILVCGLLLGFDSLYVIAVVLVGVAVLDYYVSKKIGGVTGDTLGAVTECSEAIFLLVLNIEYLDINCMWYLLTFNV
ncbi:MAG: adenosylcobinamide-GDP ribazoletransferase [Clostridiales bacterium]|nr:adenosylcobinamide-GDP ribazoletransferase [Clostridiales bacterium]MCF8021391.1 adenosylcobinamide-GDP ribazoletransferase [Clostridiales bacterium]